MKKLTAIVICLILIQSIQRAGAQSWSLSGNAGTDPATQFIGTTDNKALRIRTNNSVRVTINSAGKVGIGTTVPAFKLDVVGSINTDSVYRIVGNSVLSVKGTANTFVGINSGFSNTTGFNNAGDGFNALFSNTSGNYNTASGCYALSSNTTASYNTANGYYTLAYNTTGHDNTASGYLTLAFNNSGSYNTASGTRTLFSNSTGNYNTALGVQALYSNTTGNYNTANGLNALYVNTTGIYNTATGVQALFNNSTGKQNTAIGLNALYNTTASDGNTALGYEAGYLRNNGYYNTYLGDEADANGNGYYNSIAIGNISTVTAPLQVRVGSSLMTSIGGYANWSNLSDGRYKKNVKEDVKGIDFIMKLRPVTYNLDVSGISEKLNESRGHEMNQTNKDAIAQKEKIVYSGFIAQEVEQAAKETGYDFSGVDAPKNENDLYGLRYAEFVVPLVKAVQELGEENARLLDGQGKLKLENSELKDQITKLNEAVFGSKMNNGSIELKSEIILGQNIPNPFDNSTLIPFHLPQNCNNASIMITNTSTSEVIRIIPVSCNDDHVSIDAGTLASGMYSYTLYVDGKMLDTKQMVLTK